MWNWAHFKDTGWLAHTRQAAGLSALLLFAGMAMVLHMLVPFWQQPRGLRCDAVACALCACVPGTQMSTAASVVVAGATECAVCLERAEEEAAKALKRETRKAARAKK